MSRRWMKIAVFATVVLAFMVRVWHLDVRSIWFDEAFSWTLSSFGPLEIIQRTGSDCHPPFYYLMLWGWIKLFGDSLWAMRLLSAVCGTAAVWVAWRVGKEAIEWTSPPVENVNSQQDAETIQTGDLVGLMFAMFVASSAFQIHWSGEIRMYAMLSLVYLSSVWFGLLALRHHQTSTKPLIGFVVSSALMMYTHNFGLFSFVAVCATLTAMAWWRERKDAHFRASRMSGRLILASGIAGLLYVPWLPYLLHQRSQVAANYWVSRFSWTQLALAWDGLVFPENSYGSWQATRGYVVLAVTLIVLLTLLIRPRGVDFLSLMLTAIPATLAVGISITSTSIVSYRFFVLIHLSALLAVARDLQKWLEPVAALAMAVLLFANGLWIHHQYAEQLDSGSHSGTRDAMAWLDSVRTPDENVYVLHSCLYFSMKYHAADRQHVVLCTPQGNVVHYTGAPVLVENERRDLDALTDTAGRVWVVDCTGFTAGYSRPFFPGGLKWKEEKRFSCPHSFEGQVVVSEYRFEHEDTSHATKNNKNRGEP